MTDGELLPHRVFLLSDPTVTVARAGLGLTLYLDDARYWAIGGAASLLKRFLEMLTNTSFFTYPIYFTTSHLDSWLPLRHGDVSAIGEELTLDAFTDRLRHLFEFRLVDDPGAPRFGFVYREVNGQRATCTGYVQLFFSNDYPPNELLALAIELGHEAPLLCGVGGWLARWNPGVWSSAFEHIYGWTRRYLGLDVQVPSRMSYYTWDALPSVNWLTLIGEPLLPLVEERADMTDLPSDVAVMTLQRALLVRAGETPTLGDVNAMEYPTAISVVAQRLASLLVQAPPAFPHRFREEEVTEAWLHRFASPEGWR